MNIVEATATVPAIDPVVADLEDIGTELSCTIQAFDARYVVDRTHLVRAVTLADRARDRGEEIARRRDIDILLYAAGRRQIDDALTMGLSTGTFPAVVVIDHPEGATDVEETAAKRVLELTAFSPAATLGEYDPDRVRTFFDITETELSATAGDLADIVHERVAMLEIEK